MKTSKKQKARRQAVDAIEEIIRAAKELAQAEQVYYGQQSNKQSLFSKLVIADEKKRLLLFREIQQQLVHQGVYIKFG